MCVIIHLPAGKTLEERVLKACYETNRDGWGIMAAEGGKIFHAKDVSSFDEFLKVWKDVPPEIDRAVHFRIKTAGNINQANCHPFFPEEEIGVMHNGYIDTVLVDEGMSDTHNFVKHELKNILAGWQLAGIDFMQDDTFVKMVEKLTGNSKLLFMTKEGKVLKTNTKVWVTRYECEFSNSSWSHKLTTTTDYSASNYNYGRGSYNSSHFDRSYKSEEEKTASQTSPQTLTTKFTNKGGQNDELFLAWQEEQQKLTPPESKLKPTIIIEGSTTQATAEIIGAVTPPVKEPAIGFTYKDTVKKPNNYAPLREEPPKSDLVSAYLVQTDAETAERRRVALEEMGLSDADFEVCESPFGDEDGYWRNLERNDGNDLDDPVPDEEDDVVVGEVEDEEDDQPELPLTYNQAMGMSYEEMAEWVEYYPVSAHQLIEEMLGELVSAGIITPPATHTSTQGKEEASTVPKLAVQK